MKRNLLFIQIAWCLISILTGSQLAAEDRSYTKYLRDENGNQILRLTVTYIGKQPIGEFEWHGEVDWRDVPLDFYTVEWSNLSSDPIDFIQEKTYTQSGDDRKEYRQLPDGRKEVVLVPNVSTRIYAETPREHGNTLDPYETQTSENLFYGIAENRKTNIAFWEVTVRHLNQEYIVKYHLIGTR